MDNTSHCLRKNKTEPVGWFWSKIAHPAVPQYFMHFLGYNQKESCLPSWRHYEQFLQSVFFFLLISQRGQQSHWLRGARGPVTRSRYQHRHVSRVTCTQPRRPDTIFTSKWLANFKKIFLLIEFFNNMVCL